MSEGGRRGDAMTHACKIMTTTGALPRLEGQLREVHQLDAGVLDVIYSLLVIFRSHKCERRRGAGMSVYSFPAIDLYL